MSAVERTGWMDAQASEIIRQNNLREQKIIQEHFRRMEEEGMIPSPPPKSLDTTTPLHATHKPTMPAALTTLARDPLLVQTTELSRLLWSSSNPAYTLRDPNKFISTTKADFTYQEEEIAFYKEQGALGSTKHHRRRDEATKFVEAAALARRMAKGNASGK